MPQNAYVQRWDEDAMVFGDSSFDHVKRKLAGGLCLRDIMKGANRTSARGNGELLEARTWASGLCYTRFEWVQDWQYDRCAQLCIRLGNDERGA